MKLTEENVELRVVFREISDNTSTFLVYLRNGSVPDDKNYDALQKLPRALREHENRMDEETMKEARYTAVFPTDVLAGVGDYYVGVVPLGKVIFF